MTTKPANGGRKESAPATQRSVVLRVLAGLGAVAVAVLALVKVKKPKPRA